LVVGGRRLEPASSPPTCSETLSGTTSITLSPRVTGYCVLPRRSRLGSFKSTCTNVAPWPYFRLSCPPGCKRLTTLQQDIEDLDAAARELKADKNALVQKAHRMVAHASQLAERIAREDHESASVIGPILLEMKATAERLCAALQ
jgi:hypothetical protein